jgi:hypothetical protein
LYFISKVEDNGFKPKRKKSYTKRFCVTLVLFRRPSESEYEKRKERTRTYYAHAIGLCNGWHMRQRNHFFFSIVLLFIPNQPCHVWSFFSRTKCSKEQKHWKNLYHDDAGPCVRHTTNEASFVFNDSSSILRLFILWIKKWLI